MAALSGEAGGACALVAGPGSDGEHASDQREVAATAVSEGGGKAGRFRASRDVPVAPRQGELHPMFQASPHPTLGFYREGARQACECFADGMGPFVARQLHRRDSDRPPFSKP